MKRYLYLVIIILSQLVLLIRTQFTLWPEMVVYPYLLNNHFALYRDIINPYPPSVPFILSIFTKLFGYQIEPFRILTWLIIIILDLLIFLITERLTKNILGPFIATIFFAIFSIPLGINGIWFDLIQAPFILLSVYFFGNWLKDKSNFKLSVSLIMFIFAFEIKQQVAWLLFVFAAFLVVRLKKRRTRILNLLAPAFLLFLILTVLQIIIFKKLGLLGSYLFWVYDFPLFKASQMPGFVSLPNIKQVSIILSIIFLVTPHMFSKKIEKKFLAICSMTAVLFAYPRFEYFHLISSLAIVSVVLGSEIQDLKNKGIIKNVLLFFAVLWLSIFGFKYYKNNQTNVIRFFEPEMYKYADLINLLSPPGPIYIQNGPDQLLVLSGRLPTKPWAIQFPWYLELPGMQTKITNSLKEQKPDFIVDQSYSNNGKYSLGSYKPRQISSYLDKNYKNYFQMSQNLWLKKRI